MVAMYGDMVTLVHVVMPANAVVSVDSLLLNSKCPGALCLFCEMQLSQIGVMPCANSISAPTIELHLGVYRKL